MFGKFRTWYCNVLQMGWFVEVKFQDMEWLESNCLDDSYPTDLETKAAWNFFWLNWRRVKSEALPVKPGAGRRVPIATFKEKSLKSK